MYCVVCGSRHVVTGQGPSIWCLSCGSITDSRRPFAAPKCMGEFNNNMAVEVVNCGFKYDYARFVSYSGSKGKAWVLLWEKKAGETDPAPPYWLLVDLTNLRVSQKAVRYPRMPRWAA